MATHLRYTSCMGGAKLKRRLRGDSLGRTREICLGLPETAEVEAWGHPTFRVRNKIFASYGKHDECPCVTMKVTHAEQEMMLGDARFFRPAYVGHKGWVGIRLEPPVDWPMVRELVTRSYSLIAPRGLAARVEAAEYPAGEMD